MRKPTVPVPAMATQPGRSSVALLWRQPLLASATNSNFPCDQRDAHKEKQKRLTARWPREEDVGCLLIVRVLRPLLNRVVL
jgi:hypothetical protein